jgi:EAL domain-containing protein (putative c-di-GMP-specific phosphodiesterase class I)
VTSTSSALPADLVGAVERGEIVAYFQPQIDVASGTIVAVEALARWEHPQLGQLAPQEFIALAEETGLIHSIGRHMLEQCLDAAEEWRQAETHLEVSVNVSPLQLAAPDFSEHLSSELRRRALPQDAVTIEITESMPVTDLPEVVVRLRQLRSLGLGVAIDDFGVGHATIEQLHNLPVTELKLDRSLIQDDDESMITYLGEIVDLAHERGLRVVAEGIETEEHLSRIRTLGCDRAQGYLLGRPMPRADVELLLSA